MKVVNKKIVIIVFFLQTAIGFSQYLVQGKVVDQNGVALKGTSIINTTSGKIATSNFEGIFNLEEEGEYIFQKKGYQLNTIELKSNQFNIIQLSLNSFELDEVIVNANHIPQKLKKATATIAIISQKDILRSNNTDFAPILNRTPGVFMQNGALNTNRITIRGIGARNLFGTSKIRAYFKDIPLTNGSGETTLEDFELASIANFEIIKGAASSIYGAGLGGVIQLKPKNAYLNEFSLQPEFSVGSFGLNKSILTANYGGKQNAFKAVYSNTESTGFRENNQYNRETFTVNSNHYINKNNELTFLASYVALKAFIPSSINEETFRENPESAAFTWKRAQGFEDSKRGVFGVSLDHKINNNLKLISCVFTSFRQNYEPRPFNILEEQTFALGARSRFLGNHKILKKEVSWTFGAEVFNDRYRSKTFENLYQDFPPENGSVQGELLSNFKENRSYYNVFAEANYQFSTKTTVKIGINLNETWYKLTDRFEISENNPDQSGNFSFKTIVSPKIGISHLFSDNLSVFSSISHGFSTLSLEETLLPNGQINTNLQPETGWNFEIGARSNFLNNRLLLNVSLFRLNIKNLLVSRRTSEDEFIGINAGKTQHDGLEAELLYKWVDNKNLAISSYLNVTANNFIFKEFIDHENNFSGNDLTGVPSSIFNAGVDFNFQKGFYGNINYQYVGSMPITDANSLYSDAYRLTNLKAGYLFNLLKEIKINAFFGVNNLFNESYASQILINASSFGGNAPRYFYPGNPINYFAGINFNYLF
ncbi:TonB-dependent receptor [uncultured Polaribacter sp.]|uniref:TonB-dependent receptor domain-containing protein n=1 Tax=uncultured Polaribacter sp. TaxID=174711 RepID=UPI00262C5FAB|nr:TonB-dependent receptor [uncultured Polaribacter sp.]